MAEYEITVSDALLSNLLSGSKEGLGKLMEMVVNGISTWKVAKITEELCEISFSKSTVSCLCMMLNAREQALPEKYRRRLKPTNMQERLIQEIRRRERVIRIFPTRPHPTG